MRFLSWLFRDNSKDIKVVYYVFPTLPFWDFKGGLVTRVRVVRGSVEGDAISIKGYADEFWSKYLINK